MEKTVDFDPRLDKAQKRLAQLIQYEVHNRKMTRHTIQRVTSLANEFGVHCRLKGIDFPHIVILGLPKINQILVWPANASYDDVQVRVRQLVIQMRRVEKEVDAEELAQAIRQAYPDYGNPMGDFLGSFREKSKLPIYDN